MGLTARDSGGGQDFTPIPEGLHHGICYGIFDIGTHFNTAFSKWVHQCIIVFELPDERMTTQDNKDLPRAISKKFTVSLHEKAELRKMLETWRGRKFTDEEKQGFDIKVLLGINCMIQVLHDTKGEKIYANIAGITMLPKGIGKKEPENKLAFFSFEDREDLPGNTPKWIKKMIEESREWGTHENPSKEESGQPDDDIPF